MIGHFNRRDEVRRHGAADVYTIATCGDVPRVLVIQHAHNDM